VTSDYIVRCSRVCCFVIVLLGVSVIVVDVSRQSVLEDATTVCLASTLSFLTSIIQKSTCMVDRMIEDDAEDCRLQDGIAYACILI
jgi:hypothetical protein